MYILAIETTGIIGSVSVISVDSRVTMDDIRGGKKDLADIPMKVTTLSMSHLKNLMKMTEELFSEEGLTPGDIEAIAVSQGPGSFTGIRIGVSTGRALAQALDVPCVGVPSLSVFSMKAGKGKPVCVTYNARRGQVYAAAFDEEGNEVIKPGAYMLKDVLDDIEEKGISPVFYGDGIDAYEADPELGERLSKYRMADKDDRYQTARMAAVYALEKYKAGGAVGYGELLPDYMREAEAEQRLKDGSLERMRKEKLERLMRS